MRILPVILLLLFYHTAEAQTGPGIGLYPTGSEPGIGFRSGKDAKWVLDALLAKINLYHADNSAFISEISIIHRLVYLEKVRFNLGIGYRGNWNFADVHKQGVVLPLGVEAFPFPFQNAGLVFETAPYFESLPGVNWNISLRTVAGFIFYFPVKESKKKDL